MRASAIAFLLFLIYTAGFAQTNHNEIDKSVSLTADSINVFYKALFKTLKAGYIDRKSVDWETVEDQTFLNLRPYTNFKSSLKEITNLFDKINANHCQVYMGEEKYTVTRKAIAKDLYSAQWKNKYDSKPAFEVKVLDGKYGYILMPGMVFSDHSAAHISEIVYNGIDGPRISEHCGPAISGINGPLSFYNYKLFF